MQIVVHVNSDTQPEADESYRVNLSNPHKRSHRQKQRRWDHPERRPLSGTGINCEYQAVYQLHPAVPGCQQCTYRLEYKSSLDSGASWTNLRTVSGIGGTIAVTDTNATTQARLLSSLDPIAGRARKVSEELPEEAQGKQSPPE